MTSKSKLKASQRLKDYPNEGFVLLDGNLYCNLGGCHVSWIHKSEVMKHTATAKHGNDRKRSLPNESLGDGDPGYKVLQLPCAAKCFSQT